MNKVVSSISHDLIVGGLGALSGIVTGSGNIGLDATAGGLTSLQQPVPKAEKPKDQKKDNKTTNTNTNTNTKTTTTTGEPDAPKK